MSTLPTKKENQTVFDSEPGSNMYEYTLQLERVKTELQKFGVSPNQAKVYIYLGKYGPKTAPEVFKALDLPRTETYYILNTLQNHGIITSALTSPITYTALPFDKAISSLINAEKLRLDALSGQQKELSKIWDNIPQFVVQTNESSQEKLQMIQGIPQILSKTSGMINNAREEILIFGSEKDLSKLYHANIFDLLYNSILDVKVIVSPGQTLPEFAEKIDKRRIKLMPRSKKDNQCFIIKDQNEILMFLRNSNYISSDMFAVWSDSKSLTDAMHNLFEYSWDEAEVSF